MEIVPHLAKWSKNLYVIQRTPASVGFRNQRETDEEWFRKEVAGSKGIEIFLYVFIYVFPFD